MVNCCLCSRLKRKEEKEAESGSRGELAKKYAAKGRVQGCKQIPASAQIRADAPTRPQPVTLPPSSDLQVGEGAFAA
jgi:hypothetical protein